LEKSSCLIYTTFLTLHLKIINIPTFINLFILFLWSIGDIAKDIPATKGGDSRYFKNQNSGTALQQFAEDLYNLSTFQ